MFPVSAQNLYFITGTPTPKVNAAFDTILYRLDAASGATSKIRDLVAPGNGSNFIETSWDNRTLIIGYPYFRPTSLAVVSLAEPKTIPIDLPKNVTIFRTSLLAVPAQGLVQAFALTSGSAPIVELRGTAIGLAAPASGGLVKLPWADLSYAVADGLTGGGQGGDDTILVSAGENQTAQRYRQRSFATSRCPSGYQLRRFRRRTHAPPRQYKRTGSFQQRFCQREGH